MKKFKKKMKITIAIKQQMNSIIFANNVQVCVGGGEEFRAEFSYFYLNFFTSHQYSTTHSIGVFWFCNLLIGCHIVSAL